MPLKIYSQQYLSFNLVFVKINLTKTENMSAKGEEIVQVCGGGITNSRYALFITLKLYTMVWK